MTMVSIYILWESNGIHAILRLWKKGVAFHLKWAGRLLVSLTGLKSRILVSLKTKRKYLLLSFRAALEDKTKN